MSQINVHTVSEIDAMRREIARRIFGTEDLSYITATGVTSVSPLAGIPTATTVQRLNCGGVIFPRMFTPPNPNGELFIHALGHSMGYDSLGAGDLTRMLLAKGFTVAVVPMPGGDEVTSGSSGSHTNTSLLHFLRPTVAITNTYRSSFSRTIIGGLSGGGWHTTACAFLGLADLYIAIAGSFPLSISLTRDHEQRLPGIAPDYGYEDAYIAGAVSGGRFVQIHHTLDGCCFNKAQYDTDPYAPAIAAKAESLGGDYELIWVSQVDHTISEEDRLLVFKELGIEMTTRTEIIDNGEPGLLFLPSESDWTEYPDSNANQGDLHYAAAGDGSKKALWTIPAEIGDIAKLYLTWRGHSNRATDVPCIVRNGSQTTDVGPINQEPRPPTKIDGVYWRELGTFNVVGRLTVEINNNCNEYVIADALRAEITSDGGGDDNDDTDPPPPFDWETLRSQLKSDATAELNDLHAKIDNRINVAKTS